MCDLHLHLKNFKFLKIMKFIFITVQLALSYHTKSNEKFLIKSNMNVIIYNNKLSNCKKFMILRFFYKFWKIRPKI